MPRFGQYTDTVDDSDTVYIGPFGADQSDRIKGMLWADVDGSLTIEQSFDGENWDLVTTYAYTAADGGVGFSEEVVGNLVRVGFLNNSGGNSSGIRLYANFSSAGAR